MSAAWPGTKAVARGAAAAAAVLLGLGVGGWWWTGHGLWALLGALSVVACGGLLATYAWTLGLRSSAGSAVLPEDLARGAAFALPLAAGGAAWAATGDRRWAATGLLAGALLPGLGDSAVLAARADGPGGVVSAMVAWTFLGLLAGPLIWLWSQRPVGSPARGRHPARHRAVHAAGGRLRGVTGQPAARRCVRVAVAWSRALTTIWSRLTCGGRVAANAITSATSSGDSGVRPW